jgi:hypothetical protein
MKRGIIFVIVLVALLVVGATIYVLQQENGIDIPFLHKKASIDADKNGTNNPNSPNDISNQELSGGEGGMTSDAEGLISNDLGIEGGGRGAFLSGESEEKNSCDGFTNCTEESDSVCGWFDSNQLVCTEGPCVKRFINACEACADSRVLYWTFGECPFHA